MILYVDIESYAIVMMEYYWPGYSLKTSYYWSKALYKKKQSKCKDEFSTVSYKITVKYKKYKDKWCVNYIKRENEMEWEFSKHYIHKEKQSKLNYKFNIELLINNIVTDSVKVLSKDADFENKHYNILYEHDLEYNPEFWENYNMITLTDIQDSIIKQLEKNQPINKQFATNFVKDKNLKAPIAHKNRSINPHTKLPDKYYWMQDIKDTKVLEYIKKENRTRNKLFLTSN